MKTKRLERWICRALAAGMLMLAAGCANIVIRPQSDYNNGPYYCTAQMSKLIERGFEGKPAAKMLLPVFFIDWPFDAVADTVLWPYDFIAYSLRMSR